DVMGSASDIYRAELATSSKQAMAALLESGAQVANPVVTYAPLTAERMRGLLEVLVADKAVEGVLVLLAPDPLSDLESVVGALAEIAPASAKPIVTCLMGDATVRPVRHILDAVGGVRVVLAPDPLTALERVVGAPADVGPAPAKPIGACQLADAPVRPVRHILDAAGTPAFRTPESAANAFGINAAYHDGQHVA